MSSWEAEYELSCLVHAFSQWMDAKKERDKCYGECEFSPGYHCSRYDNAVSDCEAEFGNRLGQVVDRRIKHILVKVTGKRIEEIDALVTSTNRPSTQVAADKFMCTKCGFTGTCLMVTDHKCSEWPQPAHVD